MSARTLMRYGEDYPRKHDLSSVKLVASVGEVLNPPVWEWLQKKRSLKIESLSFDHTWQTETSGPLVGNPYGIAMLLIKPGSATIPLPGVEAEIVDEQGKPTPDGVDAHAQQPCARMRPSAGTGVGVKRLVGWIVGAKHIGATQPFPRMHGLVYDL